MFECQQELITVMNPWCQMVNVYRVLYQMLHCDWNAQETLQVTLKGVWSVWLQGGVTHICPVVPTVTAVKVRSTVKVP